jgi:S-adenosylmethionine:tRNA ribosyltransferase-isomerase
LLVSDFDFDLPDDLIAQQAAPRGASRLLVLDRATRTLAHDVFSNLGAHLRAGDLLVVNDTRVFAARLLGHRVPSGGAVECLLLAPGRPDDPHPSTSHPGTPHPPSPFRGSGGASPAAPRRTPPHPPAPLVCDALMHPGQKLKPGSLVRFEGPAGVLMAEVLERRYYGRRTIRLWSEGGADVETLVDALGHVPLPPYIRRADDPADRERYQTVFARARGSVAAPTAGLHFSPAVLEDLDRRGIERAAITLHVGYGTFKPVRSDIVEEHVVDPEWYEIPPATAGAVARARGEGRRVMAVGTTTTRALESAALRDDGAVEPHAAEASLFIHPGHTFRVVSGMVTNFHLPKSSLLMLVAAFAGRERILEAYRVAVAERYRFYSYGDAMLIA